MMARGDGSSASMRLAVEAHKTIGDMEPFMEMLDGMVAAVRARGFNEEQAREIVTAIFRAQGKPTGS